MPYKVIFGSTDGLNPAQAQDFSGPSNDPYAMRLLDSQSGALLWGLRPTGAQTVIDRGGATFDIRAFGGKVDGRTDDTQAWIAALSEAEHAGVNFTPLILGTSTTTFLFVPGFGSSVMMPAGVSVISAPLPLSNIVGIVGQGMLASTIQLAPGSNCDVLSGLAANGVSFGVFENFSIDGNRDNNPSGGHGFNGCFFASLLRNLYIFHCHGNGINLSTWTGGPGAVGMGTRCDQVWSQFNDGAGIAVQASAADIFLAACVLGYCGANEHTQIITAPVTTPALYTAGGIVQAVNCYFEAGGSGVIADVGASDLYLTNCNVDTNKGAGVWFRGNNTRGCLENVRFNANSGGGANTFPDIALALTAQGDSGTANINAITMIGNQFTGNNTTHCVDIQTSAALNINIAANTFNNLSGRAVLQSASPFSPTAVILGANGNFVSKQSGSGTIGGGSTVTITHGLASTPAWVNVTPTTATPHVMGVTAKGATTFVVNGTAGDTFDWVAGIAQGG